MPGAARATPAPPAGRPLCSPVSPALPVRGHLPPTPLPASSRQPSSPVPAVERAGPWCSLAGRPTRPRGQAPGTGGRAAGRPSVARPRPSGGAPQAFPAAPRSPPTGVPADAPPPEAPEAQHVTRGPGPPWCCRVPHLLSPARSGAHARAAPTDPALGRSSRSVRHELSSHTRLALLLEEAPALVFGTCSSGPQ